MRSRDYFLTLTNDGGEKIVFLCGVKTDQIHASVPAEIATIKPIPVFKFVPRFPPRQEIIMAAPLHVRNSCSRKQTLAKWWLLLWNKMKYVLVLLYTHCFNWIPWRCSRIIKSGTPLIISCVVCQIPTMA